MDPMLLEDPDARPKRLVMLAVSGIAVATVFATTAAAVVGAQQHDAATPDFTLKPTATSRPAETFATPPLLPPPEMSSIEASETSTSRSKSASSSTFPVPSSETPTDVPAPMPPEPHPTPSPTPRPTPTIIEPTTPTKPPTPTTEPPTTSDPTDSQTFDGDD
ncbi:hypothetical protein [Saccharopolyspora sp. ASAGF58]|uniref:hypothetical protein n=1 Tax=Saccharopolyspora sp. ASAGF58 TaxID=2719023 RepID=UPI00143FE3DB|nr:hypothetical protein [Saccharopolyspora sp. ASAGF58]QIZ34264.1 hypothetical protein FDZ84_05340 [Saccharopolyspora sp. ASAGF58]